MKQKSWKKKSKSWVQVEIFPLDSLKINKIGYPLSFLIEYSNFNNLPLFSVSNEKTALFVKLFKVIFSAIGAAQHITTEGELMLKPYLPDLIRKATEYALTAKEPLNYFLLLRALFRSIGGGAHDILYGQFLPLLPNLLQFLNKLQVILLKPKK